MRKALPCMTAIILVLVLFESCATQGKKETVLTGDECRYTLGIVLRQATDAAIPALFVDASNYNISMVPSEYSYLDRLRTTIPGMDRLLRIWETDVLSFIFPYFGEFSVYLEAIPDSYVPEDPVGLIESGAGSLSADIRRTFGDEMTALVGKRLEGLETETWAEIVVQYNAWAHSMDNLYGLKYPAIDPGIPYETLLLMLSRHLADVYLDTLSSCEVLIRTTPDPDMDPVAARVLGLE